MRNPKLAHILVVSHPYSFLYQLREYHLKNTIIYQYVIMCKKYVCFITCEQIIRLSFSVVAVYVIDAVMVRYI